MKRINQLLLFYAFLFFTAIFVQGCCLGDSTIIEGEGNIRIVDENEMVLDTLDGPFTVVLEPQLQLSENSQNFSLLNSAYAVTCDNPIENRIDVNTVDVSFDKTITLNGQQILGGTNLLDQEGVRFIDGDYSGGFLRVEVEFGQSFTDNVVFDSNRYDITLKMNTDDNVAIENTISAFVKL